MKIGAQIVRRLLRVFAYALPSAEHTFLPLLLRSGMIFSLDVSSVEKSLLTTLSKAACPPISTRHILL